TECLVFGGDLQEAAAGDVHLVERLHRSQPRRAALVRLAYVRLVASCLRHRRQAPSRSRRAIMVKAARAAKPPLSPSLLLARVQACASFSVVNMPLPMASDSS